MLIVPKFINYERPEGYTPDAPQVLVRNGVLKRFGEVSVDYPSLAEYFERFDRRPDATTLVLYHSAKFGEGVLPKGLQHTPHIPYTNTFHVNTWRRFYYPEDIDGKVRPGPADVMALLLDRMLHTIDVDSSAANPGATLRDHRQDISFVEFPNNEPQIFRF